MADIYVPGVKGRFDTEKLVEDLMRVERVPKERAEKNVETLEADKTYWQEVGRRITTLRESARTLYSYQNPFNDRTVASENSGVITGAATREAEEQEHRFLVKETAAADRFLSAPLEDSFKIEGGTYTFSTGKEEVSFNFRGGTLKEFAEALNRRGRDKIHAEVMSVKPGTKSLLIESKITGAGNRLRFAADAEKMALDTGLIEKEGVQDVALDAAQSGPQDDPALVRVADGALSLGAGGRAVIPLPEPFSITESLALSFEAAAEVLSSPPPEPEEEAAEPELPAPTGPQVPPPGGATYGGITVTNDGFQVPLPPPPPPKAPAAPPPQKEGLGSIALGFSDGTFATLSPIEERNRGGEGEDREKYAFYQYALANAARGKSVVSIEFSNYRDDADLSIKNLRVFDSAGAGGFKPKNAVSVARDAVVVMDGIEVRRPTNTIDDLIPGVTVTPRGPSDRPVSLKVEPDREGIKEAILALVGNYNRLMADVNVLTRNDAQIIDEITYLDKDEREAMKEKLGRFSGDSTLSQFRSNLYQAVTGAYRTSDGPGMSLLSQLGIGTDVRRASSAGYDASRLRGYLEIDEKVLDEALEKKLPAIKELFGFDTDGDMLVDAGLAFTLDTLSKPYVETGGFITQKGTMLDSRITQERRRIDTLDRQLAQKESDLKRQYSQMEGAYNRMDQMSTSLDQFSRRNENKD